MMDTREVMAECERRLIVLYRDGGRLMAHSLCPEADDFDLDPDLEDAIRQNKAEILEVLDYEVKADRMLLSTSAFLATRWPPGCPLEGKGWESLEKAVRDAYRSLSQETLQDALDIRESFALATFDHFTTEVLHDRHRPSTS